MSAGGHLRSSAGQAALWGAALVASVLAHVGIIGVMVIAARPAPLEREPETGGSARIQAHTVPQSRAEPRPPESEAAPPGDAAGARTAQGAVPVSRAQPLAAPAQSLAAAPATAAPEPALTPQGPAQAARPASVQDVSAAALPATTIGASADNAQALTPTSATPMAMASATLRTAPSAASPLVGEQTSPLTPEGDSAAALAPPANPASPAPLPADSATAITGWAGAAGEGFDPVSLAAVQSFMRPLEADQGPAARDVIADMLGRIDCARLQATFLPDQGVLELRGHIPDESVRTPVLDALRAQLGGSIPVTGSVTILPSPQCNVLGALERSGLPQTRYQQDDPMQVGALPQLTTFRYAEGERLEIRLRNHDWPAWVYVDFFDVQGRVIHLRPSEWEELEQYQPGALIEVGVASEGRSSVHVRVAPPFGTELIVAFASSEPLYEGLRPQFEPADDYLAWLRGRVEALRDQHPDYRGEWVYLFVETHAADEG